MKKKNSNEPVQIIIFSKVYGLAWMWLGWELNMYVKAHDSELAFLERNV